MTAQSPAKSRKRDANTQFWRACGYLAPYRRIVAISIVCALAVGFIFTTGLGAMLPILQVLIKGDTIQIWLDRQIVEQRWGVRLLDDPLRVQITQVKPGGIADAIGTGLFNAPAPSEDPTIARTQHAHTP